MSRARTDPPPAISLPARLQVIITADLEKSPPVIKVFAVNPYSKAA